MDPGRDRMGPVAKFVSPTVADGRVYVPTFGNMVVVYGQLNSATEAPAEIRRVAFKPQLTVPRLGPPR